MKTHELNIENDQFDPIQQGKHRALLYNNAVPFAVGDMLILHEYEPLIFRRTGRTVVAKVTFVFNGFGLQTNYAAVSLRVLK